MQPAGIAASNLLKELQLQQQGLSTRWSDRHCAHGGLEQLAQNPADASAAAAAAAHVLHTLLLPLLAAAACWYS